MCANKLKLLQHSFSRQIEFMPLGEAMETPNFCIRLSLQYVSILKYAGIEQESRMTLQSYGLSST